MTSPCPRCRPWLCRCNYQVRGERRGVTCSLMSLLVTDCLHTPGTGRHATHGCMCWGGSTFRHFPREKCFIISRLFTRCKPRHLPFTHPSTLGHTRTHQVIKEAGETGDHSTSDVRGCKSPSLFASIFSRKLNMSDYTQGNAGGFSLGWTFEFGLV